jgi:transposase
MTIVAGFDVHRAQITFDALKRETGEVHTGRIAATPEAVRRWVGRFPGERIHVAVEACTGWLFVCEARGEAAPSRTSPRRPRRAPAAEGSGAPRPTAPTPAGCAPCSRRVGCPRPGSRPHTCASGAPAPVCGGRSVDERTSWLQRIQATLFHHRIGGVPDQLLRARGRAFLSELELTGAARERIWGGARDDRRARPPARPARARGPGARAPPGGVPGADEPLRHRAGERDQHRLRTGRRVAPVGVAQGGALRRPRRRGAPLRPPGAGRKAGPAGSPQLRWALYESAQSACKPASPDYADYHQLKARGLSHTRATMTIARKLARRCFHSLRELGPAALEPVT